MVCGPPSCLLPLMPNASLFSFLSPSATFSPCRDVCCQNLSGNFRSNKWFLKTPPFPEDRVASKRQETHSEGWSSAGTSTTLFQEPWQSLMACPCLSHVLTGASVGLRPCLLYQPQRTPSQYHCSHPKNRPNFRGRGPSKATATFSCTWSLPLSAQSCTRGLKPQPLQQTSRCLASRPVLPA